VGESRLSKGKNHLDTFLSLVSVELLEDDCCLFLLGSTTFPTFFSLCHNVLYQLGGCVLGVGGLIRESSNDSHDRVWHFTYIERSLQWFLVDSFKLMVLAQG
jgi:hypothetical protein